MNSHRWQRSAVSGPFSHSYVRCNDTEKFAWRSSSGCTMGKSALWRNSHHVVIGLHISLLLQEITVVLLIQSWHYFVWVLHAAVHHFISRPLTLLGDVEKLLINMCLLWLWDSLLMPDFHILFVYRVDRLHFSSRNKSDCTCCSGQNESTPEKATASVCTITVLNAPVSLLSPSVHQRPPKTWRTLTKPATMSSRSMRCWRSTSGGSVSRAWTRSNARRKRSTTRRWGRNTPITPNWTTL